jgi:hypothetical protein
MAITNLQQARQMYALGQRVRFQGGGRDASQSDFSSPSADTGNTDGGTGAVDTGDLGTEKANVEANLDANMSSRDRAIMNQYKNLRTPTVTVGVDKFDNPITVPTTYTAKRARQQMLNALNEKGISAFDPRVTRTINPFNLSFVAPPTQKKFSFVKDFVVPAGLSLINPGLAAKYNKAKFAYNTAKDLATIAETIGLTDKNVVEAFTNTLTDSMSGLGKGKSSTKGKDDDTPRGGDGIEGLGDKDALNQEYLLLLKKFNQGVFTDEDEVRFTFLQKILGK